jgi:hypothetical protein
LNLLAIAVALGAGQQSAGQSSGQELLDALHARMRQVKAVKLELVLKYSARAVSGQFESASGDSMGPRLSLVIGKGGYVRHWEHLGRSVPETVVVGSPTRMLTLFLKQREYLLKQIRVPGLSIDVPGFEAMYPKLGPLKAAGDVRRTTFHGKEALAVPIAEHLETGMQRQTLYIDPEGKYPLGAAISDSSGSAEAWYQNIKLDPQLPAGTFSTTPPKGWKRIAVGQKRRKRS